METEEMLEQTNETENVETQTTEEMEEGIELDDSTLETEESEEQSEEETVTEEKEEKAKSLKELLKGNKPLQDEVNEIVENRLKRERRVLEIKHEEELNQFRTTEDILKFGLKKDNLEDINNELRGFYKEQGIDIPTKQERIPEKYEKIIAEAEANEILELGLDLVEEEANKLASKGVANMTNKEKIIFSKLAETLTLESKKKSLAEIGVKPEILNDKEFSEFASQFDKKTPISKVYDLYTKTQTEAPVEPIGSLKNSNSKEEKTYYTSEEVDKLTEKELDNPMIQKRVRESMLKWK